MKIIFLSRQLSGIVINNLFLVETTMALSHTTTRRMHLMLLRMEASCGSQMNFNSTCALEAGDSFVGQVMLIWVRFLFLYNIDVK